MQPNSPFQKLLDLKSDITALSVFGRHELLIQRATTDIGHVLEGSEDVSFGTVYAYAQQAPTFTTSGTCTLEVLIDGVSILTTANVDLTALSDETLTELTLLGPQVLEVGQKLSILATTSDDELSQSNGLAVYIEQ